MTFVSREKPSLIKHRFMQPDNLTLYAFLFLPLVLILVFFLYPLVAVFFYSFNDLNSLVDPFKFHGLENFRWALSNPYFGQAIRNTLLFTVLSLLGQTTLGILSALILNQDELPARTFFRGVLLFAWVMPELIVAAIFLMIFGNNISVVNYWLEQLGLSRVGWLNDPDIALYTLIIVNIWKGLPFNIIIYLTALQGISKDYYEAAKLDGANVWQQFQALTFPFLLPTILSTLILSTIWTSNVFFLPFVMTGGGPLNATMLWSLSIYNTIFKNLQLSRGAAMSVIVYLILLAIGIFYYIFLRRNQQELK